MTRRELRSIIKEIINEDYPGRKIRYPRGISILPSGTKLNLLHPQQNEFYQDHKDGALFIVELRGKYILLSGHGNFKDYKEMQVGKLNEYYHDQTLRELGSGKTLFAFQFKDLNDYVEQIIEKTNNKSLPYYVFK